MPHVLGAGIALCCAGAVRADDGVFKVSEKANVVVILKASDEGTDFFVSGIHVGRGKSVRIKIEKKQKYEVRAKPEGCRARDDTLSPPYRTGQEFEFQFMIEDCAPQIIITDPSGEADTKTPALDVAFLVEARAQLVDLALILNGDKQASESTRLVAELGSRGQTRDTAAARPFKTKLRLRAGPNTIRIEATDRDGKSGSASIIVTYKTPSS